MHRNTLITALVTVAAIIGSAHAQTTYYVDANCGDDAWGGTNPVCAKPDGAKATIQAAIDAAVSGDEIEVGPGTYVELIDLLGKAITLRSTDGPTTTIIDGDASGSVITCVSGEGPDTVIEGFTITNGTGTILGAYGRTYGGGLLNDGSSPTLTNCTISENTASSGGGMFSDNNSSPTLTNCTFSGNTATYGGGMSSIDSSSPTLANCGFSGNTASHGGGMHGVGSSSPTLTNCTFSGNTASRGGGIYSYIGSPALANCAFSGNSATLYGGGMYSQFDCSPTLINCTFSGNSAEDRGGGMYNFQNSSPTLTNCILWGNIAPTDSQVSNDDDSSMPTVTYSCIEGGWPGVGNIDADPLFYDAANHDVHLQEGSLCINAGYDRAVPTDLTTDLDGDDRIQHCRVDIGADEAPFVGPDCNDNGVVDACESDGALDCNENAVPDLCDLFDGTSADDNANGVPDECERINNITQDTYHVRIQGAVDAAFVGDDIEVGPGTYVECINLLGKALKLRSTDGPATTIIDGNADGGVITCESGEGPDTVIDGFTITNGQTYRGGGIYNEQSSPTLTNCTFAGNTATYSGGGMYNYRDSNPTLINCTFSGNSAISNGGGVFNDFGCSPTVTNCTFSGNTAYFCGGMYNTQNSSPTLTNCNFSGNTASSCGGMYNCGSPTLANCTFSGNTATSGGGGMYNNRNSSPALINCTFSGNTASFGGGMHNHGSFPTVTNCTFSGNTAGYNGGGMYNYDSSSTLTNCILWGNTAPDGPQIYNNDTSTTTATYSCIQGGWPGAGNINADPLFYDAVNHDVHLLEGSPCINAGDDSAVPAGVTTDLDGDDRFQHCRVDMGVDETPYIGSDCNDNGVADECDTIQGGDFDADGDIDLDDYTWFVDSMAGPDQPPHSPNSECLSAYLTAFDLDTDGDIDLKDFALFQEEFTGP